MLSTIRREPALLSGLVSAAIALAVAFGLDLSGEQTGAIMAVTAAVLAILVRSQVTPTVTVAAEEPKPGGATIAGPAAAEADPGLSVGDEVTVTRTDPSPPPPEVGGARAGKDSP